MRQAKKAKDALIKKGVPLEPVSVAGKAIAGTWWGKAWTQNLERYADYSNRIPRGRTYVRSGAVLDLKISPNTITALVSGSRTQPYRVSITIQSLASREERALMDKSRTSLDSLPALLSGEFPEELKEEFFKQGTGLFPAPREIRLNCSCPDWAEMCKHVAAVLYGTAVRLDQKPELFFVLRGIKIEDFIGKMVKAESVQLLERAKAKSQRALAVNEKELSELFGIELESTETPPKMSDQKRKVPHKQQEHLPRRDTPTKKKTTKVESITTIPPMPPAIKTAEPKAKKKRESHKKDD